MTRRQKKSDRSKLLWRETERLCKAVDQQSFSWPVTHVYNPLKYARGAHRTYVERFATGPKKVVFLGMNPGPFGMAQTGIPFGEVHLVKDFLGITHRVKRPQKEHPKRPILGFESSRSEVSGRRLWGTIAERFGSAEVFFKTHYVANYCPLVFMDESGKNRTPDKLNLEERQNLYVPCDDHLKAMAEILEPEWVIGVGRFAFKMAKEALAEMDVQVGSVLHPSPASPIANRGWAEQAEAQLKALGVPW